MKKLKKFLSKLLNRIDSWTSQEIMTAMVRRKLKENNIQVEVIEFYKKEKK